MFRTTAIYPNRLTDKQKVESKLGLAEQGNDITCFYSRKGTLIATGYIRIVYGDHGPYIEFEERHIQCQLTPKFKNSTPSSSAYYEWMIPLKEPELKIYRQLRDVQNLKNPPSGGFAGNREEGYADYKPGMYYVNPWLLSIQPNADLF